LPRIPLARPPSYAEYSPVERRPSIPSAFRDSGRIERDAVGSDDSEFGQNCRCSPCGNGVSAAACRCRPGRLAQPAKSVIDPLVPCTPKLFARLARPGIRRSTPGAEEGDHVAPQAKSTTLWSKSLFRFIKREGTRTANDVAVRQGVEA
jgi:hypothetical protein